MGALPPEVLKAIDLPVKQVRRALRELDPKEIPASLRKVAATEGGRLPPPLLAKLLAELDANQWLRERLVELLDDRIDPATESFLVRGDGWWLEPVTAAVEAARTRPPRPAGDEVAELQRKLATTTERLAAARSDRDRLGVELKESRAARARLVDPDEAGAGIDGVRAENQRLTAALADAQAGRAAAEERVENLRLRSRAAGAATQIPSHPRPRAVGMGDPVDVARRLDTEIRALAAGVTQPQPEEAERPPAPAEPITPLRLPPGLSPDQPEAVAWLLDSAPPATVVVDGYNVTFLLGRVDFHGKDARNRLIGLLGRLASRKPHRFTVVFDSAQPPGEPLRRGDVEMRFSSGEKADDLIVELAATLGDLPVVVVTNDRELRERVEAVGALSLWGDALVPHLG